MLAKILKKILGNSTERQLKKLYPIVEEINNICTSFDKLSNNELREITKEIKANINNELKKYRENYKNLSEEYQTTEKEVDKESLHRQIDEAKESLKKRREEILSENLPKVYALVKQTCKRLKEKNYEFEVRGNKTIWDMVPFDVQMVGAIALHRGMIAEMATGEGKTLVATMPLFLNSLTGEGCHLVTVNDYLAQRDSEWMAPIFEFHSITVSVIVGGMENDQRKLAYSADIVYGTNSEFGFDYLRDNMAISKEHIVQRSKYFAIVDEVDSVLIDEARTPLIISGAVSSSTNFYKQLINPIKRLVSLQESFIREQQRVINQLLKGRDYRKIGIELLKIKRADPKGKIFRNFMRDGSLKDLVNDTEIEFIRDKKMHKIDETLFFIVDERANSVDLAERGQDVLSAKDKSLFVMKPLQELLDEVDEKKEISSADKMEQKEKISSEFINKSEKLHNIEQLLKAFMLFEKDDEYVVMDGRIMIVDEFTGRLMPGRRFSDGLHQALEAKHGLRVEAASQTFATITIQNYFKMYDKLSGMTGTAITEETEFLQIYNLPVMVIPTHKPISRIDFDDDIYLTKNEKYKAIINEIEYWHNLDKPILVGTVSVEVSELLSRMLKRKKISHKVLNAKQNQSEATIIKEAGKKGSITIATNMAGRGTDIKLGEGVVKKKKEHYLNGKYDSKISEKNPFGKMSDGLHVIGSERHEARRIDRQLRGRSGRQGDPGTSRFYLSLEDDLMRLFGSGKIAPMMKRLGLNQGESIRHSLMTKAVERAQKRVESYNFQIRKNLIEYDLVMNSQREVIYSYRKKILDSYSMKAEILEFIEDTVLNIIDSFYDKKNEDKHFIYLEDILRQINTDLAVNIKLDDFAEQELIDYNLICKNIVKKVMRFYSQKERIIGEENMRELERLALLESIDKLWREHLHQMDFLKEGIGLRAYAQRDPLIEYKKESYLLFQALMVDIAFAVSKKVFIYNLIKRPIESPPKSSAIEIHKDISAFKHSKSTGNAENNRGKRTKKEPITVSKVGRNKPCPCGSGKKYKKCHGRNI